MFSWVLYESFSRVAFVVACVSVSWWLSAYITKRRLFERLRIFSNSTRFRALRTNPTAPITVVVDGPIGAGKSSLLEVLRNRDYGLASNGHSSIQVCFVEEPVSVWLKVGILQKFYSSIKEWAYRFQTFVFVTRVEAIQRAVEANPNADIYVLERSIFTDRFMFVELLIEQKNMEPVEREMYLEWWRCWRHAVPIWPQGFIYLNVPSEECDARQRKRKRDGEVVPQDYNEQLLQRHDKFFATLESAGVPVLRIGTEAGNYVDDRRAAQTVSKRIYNFVWKLPADDHNMAGINEALLKLGP